LSKIKENIKDGINKAVKQTKESFDKFLKNPKSSSKEAFLNAISNPDQANIKGLDINENKLEQKWGEVDKFILSLAWANRIDFVKDLEKTKTASKDTAKLVLYDKILKKYADAKAPLINFAADLHKEGELIRKWLDELNDFKNKIKDFRDVNNKNKLDQILEKLISFDSNVEKLSIIVCDLLS
jgi:hypothetical protein